jgi:hypothetical protein
MANERLLATLGYDPSVLAALSEVERRQMRGAASAWLLACAGIGVIGGYATRFVEPWLWLSVSVAVAVALLALNLLRVTIAGGGVSPGCTATELERWKPGAAPAVVLGVVVALLAQPAQLPLWGSELSTLVEQHRQNVVAEQAAAAAALGQADALAHYHAHLGATDFPALRIQLIWHRPVQAARWTAVFCLIVLVPAIWSRSVAVRALRAYERERERRVRQRRIALARATDARVAALLSAWRDYEPSEASQLDTFGRREPSPLFAPSNGTCRPWLSGGKPS